MHLSTETPYPSLLREHMEPRSCQETVFRSVTNSFMSHNLYSRLSPLSLCSPSLCLSIIFSYNPSLTVFLELRSRKVVRFSEQIMSADKYPSISSRQMEAIIYIISVVVYYFGVHVSGDKKHIIDVSTIQQHL